MPVRGKKGGAMARGMMLGEHKKSGRRREMHKAREKKKRSGIPFLSASRRGDIVAVTLINQL
jgi:hypothetical protein